MLDASRTKPFLFDIIACYTVVFGDPTRRYGRLRRGPDGSGLLPRGVEVEITETYPAGRGSYLSRGRHAAGMTVLQAAGVPASLFTPSVVFVGVALLLLGALLLGLRLRA